MMLEKILQYKFVQFVIQQKYLFLLGGVITTLVVVTIVISIPSAPAKSGTQPTGQGSATGSSEAKKETTFFNPLAFFFPPKQPTPTGTTGATNNSGQQTQTTSTGQSGANAVSGPTSATGKSSFGGAPLTGSSGTTTTPSRSGTSSSGTTTSSGGSAGSSGSSTGGSSVGATATPIPTSTPVPANIQVIFQNPDGTTTNYIPPHTPPLEVKWGRYTNYQDNYAIDYPVNWQIDVSSVAGHEGVTVYAPGVDVTDSESSHIGFGWSTSYLIAASGSLSNTFDTAIIADSVSGTLYTNGPLGQSFIATIFPYNSGYFGLGSSSSDESFVYVYYYMLYSLRFNIQ